MNRIYMQNSRLRQQEPVREKDPVHFRTLMLIFFCCSLIVLGILSYIWRGVEILAMGYKMRAVYSQQRMLLDQRQRLLLEKSALEAPGRIESIAMHGLKLVKPKPDQIVIVRTGEGEHVP